MEVCPACGDEVPEENDDTGDGPVFWKVDPSTPYCSGECVVRTHRKWLQKQV